MSYIQIDIEMLCHYTMQLQSYVIICNLFLEFLEMFVFCSPLYCFFYHQHEYGVMVRQI